MDEVSWALSSETNFSLILTRSSNLPFEILYPEAIWDKSLASWFLSIPEWKWDTIYIGFMMSFPKKMKGCDSIWVIIDRLTKSDHFIPIKINYLLQKLAELYIEKVVSLHGNSSSIVSDRDLRFTLRFWQSLQEAMGTKLKLSYAYHSQTYGQMERAIQYLEDLLRAYKLEQRWAWDSYLSLIQFTYNNSFHSSIGMTSFKDLYGRRCMTLLCCCESGESVMLEPNIM